jgi:hypothetical protein
VWQDLAWAIVQPLRHDLQMAEPVDGLLGPLTSGNAAKRPVHLLVATALRRDAGVGEGDVEYDNPIGPTVMLGF